MNYEKKYKDALERAREWYNNSNSSSIGKSYLYAIFPELKESGNEDEKIRKEIINYFKCQSREEPSRKDTHNKWIAWLKKVIIPNHNDNDSSFIEDIKNVIDEAPLLMQSDKEKMIGWLEKQGNESVNIDIESMVSSYEQRVVSQCNGVKNNPFVNMCVSAFRHGIEDTLEELNLKKLEKQCESKSAEEVKPKFKVGDWILYSGDHYEGVRHITKINENGYYIERNGLPHGIIPFNHEICMRLWTIQDAKDGDILAFKNNIGGIIICKSPTNYDTRSYCRLINDNFINKEESGWDSTLLVPATKEQRTELFLKMHEAGYEWDAEKKELKKRNSYCQEHCKGFQETGKCFADGDCKDKKEAEQKSAVWNEDDERLCACIIKDQEDALDSVRNDKYGHSEIVSDLKEMYRERIYWLKSLKERIGG